MDNQYKQQLLCTFSTLNEYNNTISNIKLTYFLIDRTVFVFENANNPSEVILTYNVRLQEKQRKFPLTISIHRKKDTNSLFSINALNKIIMEENNGVLDKTFNIDWELYRNCLITTTDDGYKTINLNLKKIVRV